MQRNTIIVPKGIRYISEWEDFKLNNFPHILDKKIPGCGFTEYCITNNQNIILASPRKILLENKEAQHPNEVLLVRNKLDKVTRVDKNLEKKDTMLIEQDFTDIEKQQILSELKKQIEDYVFNCRNNNVPAKILVTYDSFRLVKDVLVNNGLFEYFYTVIDEFQSIFTDSRFKSDTELEFVTQLQNVSNVCFVSATPMIDKYLEMLDEFKNLPYYELDWETEEPFRIVKPNIKVRTTKSILATAAKIIEDYKSGNFVKEIVPDDSPKGYHYIESREAVFFVNSVANIINIITKSGLTANEVNILCANTLENEKKIFTKLRKKDGWSIGRVPLKNEQNKMFTFCTRTVYLGADFYSDNARSFILSDANIETLAVDITLDLPQILGRQRLLENPWKNKAELYYKTLVSNNTVLREEFDKILNRKMEESKNLLGVWNDCTKQSYKNSYSNKLIDSIRLVNYRRDYIAVNKHAGSTPVAVLNNLVLIAEMRAFDIQQIDYKDRFSVFNTIYNSGLTVVSKATVENFLSEFKTKHPQFYQLKFLCESSYNLRKEELDMIFNFIPPAIVEIFKKLGAEGCKRYGYNYANIKKALGVLDHDKDDLKTSIYSNFKVGYEIPKSDMKVCLQAIYDKLGLTKTAKATDIEEWFEVEECKKQKNGKRSWYFRLVKQK
jgi:hypothetical protein